MKKKIMLLLMTAGMIILGGCGNGSSSVGNEEEIVAMTEKQKEFKTLQDKFSSLVGRDDAFREVFEQPEIGEWTKKRYEKTGEDFYGILQKASIVIDKEGNEDLYLEKFKVVEERDGYIHYSFHVGQKTDEFKHKEEYERLLTIKDNWRLNFKLDIILDISKSPMIDLKYSDLIINNYIISSETGDFDTTGWEVEEGYVRASNLPTLYSKNGTEGIGEIVIRKDGTMTVDFGEAFFPKIEFKDQITTYWYSADTEEYHVAGSTKRYVNSDLYGFGHGQVYMSGVFYGRTGKTFLMTVDEDVFGNGIYQFYGGPRVKSSEITKIVDTVGYPKSEIRFELFNNYSIVKLYMDTSVMPRRNGASVMAKLMGKKFKDFPINFRE